MQRFHVECLKRPSESRDTYAEHATDYLDILGGEDEGENAAPVGARVEYAVALEPEGQVAFRLASNLISLEPVADAMPDGHVVEEIATEGEYAEPAGVTRVPTDADLAYLKALWLRTKTKGGGVRIAVFDQGLDAVVAGWLREMGILKGAYSYTPGDTSPTNSSASHGTHVATTATPDGVELHHYQVLADQDGGTSDRIQAAFYDAARRGCHFGNASLSGEGAAESYERALAYCRSRGLVIFCAAGNTGSQVARYPAYCSSAESISAFDRATDDPTSFTTFNTRVNLASSGRGVVAYGSGGRLVSMDGTSMATPLTTFVAASLKALSGKSPEAVVQALKGGARDTEDSALYEGAGVVRAYRANKKL